MRIEGLIGAGCLALAMAAISAVPASAAATATLRARECVAGKVTPASYTWNFNAEADRTMKYIHAEAQDALYHADMLRTVNVDSPGVVSWRGDLDELNHVKTDVNRIEAKLCRLETIRRMVDPEQQAAIDQIAASAQLMADNLQDAYNFGNNHSQQLWNPTYKRELATLDTQAHDMTHTAHQAVAYARLNPNS